ncbi:hypothetical protein K474DRAFT_140741 [Panus rudis PR-1116 ss-1]|nr:hypothetical protein K474DRAFT_140741 [Panus rudis PR-1116 ss-1]
MRRTRLRVYDRRRLRPKGEAQLFPHQSGDETLGTLSLSELSLVFSNFRLTAMPVYLQAGHGRNHSMDARKFEVGTRVNVLILYLSLFEVVAQIAKDSPQGLSL